MVVGKGFPNMDLLSEKRWSAAREECSILPEMLSNRYQKKEGNLVEPLKKPIYREQKLIPTLSCQACSKQFRLWGLAWIIYIASIILILWAIWLFVAILLPISQYTYCINP